MLINFLSSHPLFKIDRLNSFVALAIGLFFVLTCVYSIKFMRSHKQRALYYFYLVITAMAALGVVFSNNLGVLLAFWGFLGLTLYLLINMGNESSSKAAKKSLIIVGGTDALMLLGMGIIYYFSRTMRMDLIRLELNNGLLVFAYICIAIGCFAKAGAMPFHSWIPDCAKDAPLPVVAFLPASLDKLLGIYLLFRLSLSLFVMNNAMNIFLMTIGAFTIVAAVMMALVQHNLKQLLGYHAISQVGYMVLGIGTGNPIGIAGGLFHMLNNAVYKSCLFFSAGNVEYRTKTTELNELGGLAKFMPLTYISCLIASLSISGVPPFNGFVSKWLIYQGLASQLQNFNSPMQIAFISLCLIAAMFGSALTIASFMKLLHAVFLGENMKAENLKNTREVPLSMSVPCLILAFLCVVFGVFAFAIPLKYFIFPAVSIFKPVSQFSLIGLWSPALATMLMLAGLIAGFVVFKFNKLNFSLRQDSAYVGAENAVIPEENRVTGVDFYNTIKEIGFLAKIYKAAGQGAFDIYEQGKKIFRLSRFLQLLHNGIMPTYLVWILLGMAGLFFALVK